MLSNILLLITAIIWGTAFVAQKDGGEIGALTFNGVRTLLGGLVLIPVIVIMNKGKFKGLVGPDPKEGAKAPLFAKSEIIGGVFCGIALGIASNVQQYGVNFTTVSKAGFITVLYIAFVPIISVVLRKKVKPILWLCVGLGALGFYMLTLMGQEEFHLQIGDLFVLLCAFCFAVHIMVVDHFATDMDGLKLSCIQFLTAGGLTCIAMFIFEDPSWDAINTAIVPILYAGILSCGVAYTLQVVAQKWADPSVASLLMSLESVFACIAGVILLGDSMAWYQWLGCAVIFSAVIVSNLAEETKDELALEEAQAQVKE
ncbi:MAG: DMT family transporter [Clostridia bacterium]|nr:DMT family transporter [Clostridia bacterium]